MPASAGASSVWPNNSHAISEISTMPTPDVEAVLQGAVQGMDDALLRAVDAYRVGAGKMIDQGLGMQDQVMQKAVDAVEKMEDALFKALQQAADGSKEQIGKPWAAVLEKMKCGTPAAKAAAISSRLLAVLL